MTIAIMIMVMLSMMTIIVVSNNNDDYDDGNNDDINDDEDSYVEKNIYLLIQSNSNIKWFIKIFYSVLMYVTLMLLALSLV